MIKPYLLPFPAGYKRASIAWLRRSPLTVRSVAAALLLLLGACEKPDLEPQEAGVSATSKTDFAGKSKDNPFTVEVMTKALKNLQEKKSGSGDFSTLTTTLAPTHTYVRFKPADTDQLADLEALGLQLSFEPLDETAAANTYVDYSSTEIPWIYSAVPYGVALPYHIQREKLEDLYLFNEDAGDEEDEDPWEPEPPSDCYPQIQCEQSITTSSKRNNIKTATEQLKQAGILPLALYNEAMRITGHKEEIIEQPAPGEVTIQSTRYYPSGRIWVQETALQTDVPLRRVNVIARRWFKMDNRFTDDNGYFSIPKGYRDKVKLIVQFRNMLATTRGFTNNTMPWDIVLPIRYETGTYEKSQMQGMTYVFPYDTNANSKRALSWVAATLFNSLVDAHAYSTARGIATPVKDLNVWLSSNVTKDAAAPMLRRIASTSLISRALDLFLFVPNTAPAIAVKKVMQRQLPDITCRYGSKNSDTRLSDDLNNTFYHELAHSQHYGQVGNDFWTQYIAYVVANDGYGEKSSLESGRIAISEAWGNYIGFIFTEERYRTANPPLAEAYRLALENQIPSNIDPGGWIVYGMLYDMTDQGENSWRTGVVDDVNAFTPATVFRALQPDVLSVREYQEKIRVQNNNLQASQMGQLVYSYGW